MKTKLKKGMYVVGYHPNGGCCGVVVKVLSGTVWISQSLETTKKKKINSPQITVRSINAYDWHELKPECPDYGQPRKYRLRTSNIQGIPIAESDAYIIVRMDNGKEVPILKSGLLATTAGSTIAGSTIVDETPVDETPVDETPVDKIRLYAKCTYLFNGKTQTGIYYSHNALGYRFQRAGHPTYISSLESVNHMHVDVNLTVGEFYTIETGEDVYNGICQRVSETTVKLGNRKLSFNVVLSIKPLTVGQVYEYRGVGCSQTCKGVYTGVYTDKNIEPGPQFHCGGQGSYVLSFDHLKRIDPPNLIIGEHYHIQTDSNVYNGIATYIDGYCVRVDGHSMLLSNIVTAIVTPVLVPGQLYYYWTGSIFKKGIYSHTYRDRNTFVTPDDGKPDCVLVSVPVFAHCGRYTIKTDTHTYVGHITGICDQGTALLLSDAGTGDIYVIRESHIISSKAVSDA